MRQHIPVCMEVTQPVHVYLSQIYWIYTLPVLQTECNTCAGIQCCTQIKEDAMKVYDSTRDDYSYEHDKPVYVRSYCRMRNGELEHVTDHYRSYPMR